MKTSPAVLAAGCVKGLHIGAALDRIAGNVLMEDAAYYFRYLARGMGQLEKRDAVVQALAEQETMLISDGAINALGRGFVATIGQS